MGIYIGLGANLEGPAGPPQTTLELALERFPDYGLRLLKRSRWYLSDAVPDPSDPQFTNGVVQISTNLAAPEVLDQLQSLEQDFGRTRGRRWAPRILDLDLLDYDGQCLDADGPEAIELPHPRLHERAFVLLPLCEIAPEWRHPRLLRSIDALINDLPEDAVATPL